MTALPQNQPEIADGHSQRRRYSFWVILGVSAGTGLIVLGLVVVVSIIAQARWSARQHWVQVTMMGNRPIRNVAVTVGGVQISTGHIGSHTSARMRYDANVASDFEVNGRFEDGTPFSGRCGSVTPATPPGEVTIVVKEDGTLFYSDGVRP